MKKIITGVLITVAVIIIVMAAVFIYEKKCSRKKECSEMSEEEISSILEKQQILFIMSYRPYTERYVGGYVIDCNGKKHRYELSEHWPVGSIENEFALVAEHYAEFEAEDFWDLETLKNCTKKLYCVDPGAKVKKRGRMVAADAPLTELYGIRLRDGKQEFVKLILKDSGQTERLSDPSADFIIEMFGDGWNLP